jgi:hypothetical protein
LISSNIDYLQLYYTVTITNHDLVAGQTYQFRYRARNKYGWSDYSETASYMVAAVPLKADPVTTVIENLYVRISWAEPDTQASTILEY